MHVNHGSPDRQPDRQPNRGPDRQPDHSLNRQPYGSPDAHAHAGADAHAHEGADFGTDTVPNTSSHTRARCELQNGCLERNVNVLRAMRWWCAHMATVDTGRAKIQWRCVRIDSGVSCVQHVSLPHLLCRPWQME